MKVDPFDLIVFANVADTGSLSVAAQQLQLPKSTLSRRLAQLEAQLGERLLQRTTRKLSLTDFGAALLQHARQIDAETQAAVMLAEQRQATPSGRLRVSMPGDIATQLLAPVLADFRRRFPLIDLQIDLSPRRVDLIAEGFDLAIRMGRPPDDSTLIARRIWLYRAALFASPRYLAKRGNPASPDDLINHDALCLVGRLGDPMPWKLERGDEVVTPRLNAVMSINSPDLLALLAIHDCGITGVGPVFSGPRVARGELVPVLPEWQMEAVSAWAVYPERRLMPPKTRVLLDTLEAFFQTAR
ncbi:LysR family transcriptional regulator [Chitinibacteraceae bacterium HSL-7]